MRTWPSKKQRWQESRHCAKPQLIGIAQKIGCWRSLTRSSDPDYAEGQVDAVNRESCKALLSRCLVSATRHSPALGMNGEGEWHRALWLSAHRVHRTATGHDGGCDRSTAATASEYINCCADALNFECLARVQCAPQQIPTQPTPILW